MSKIKLRFTAIVVMFLLTAMSAQAVQFGMPKREFRSAWVATVWALDWPESIGTNAEKQKQQLDRMLDSLAANNFNAVNFQVRSMCDAMYNSSIEPWSSYITGTRGQNPGYDPLQYVVEGCHKRGMECHAWVNPYRWSTGTDWNTSYDQGLKNGGWLLTHGSTIILDPGQERVIQRIVDVCQEIITNYDVDGILYDDYFYPSGIPTDSSAGDYEEWHQSGTTLSFGDWRRDNVNRMVKAVYNMIQETRPDVRFGISPAGVAASSASVAGKYGLDPCPSGSDWQYNGIFSDPLAWYNDKSIDYMSPQIYWHIGASADFGKIAPWWNKVAKKFDRHMFVSHSISEVTRNSYGGENPEPSMTASNLFDEYANEVELMRTTNEDGAPGSIFYSCKYLYRIGCTEELANYLKRVTYRRPALPPAMPWKEGYNPGLVTNLNYDGSGTLSWDGYDNVRYTVYAFPEVLAHGEFNRNGEYLLGISYGTEYQIPSAYRSGYQYAVCVLDRVGNEYDPVIFGEELDPLPAPVIVAPEDGASLFSPFNFEWEAVEDATSYVLQVAEDMSFDQVTNRVTVEGTSISSAELNLLNNTTQYWRVLACAEGRANGISERRSVVPQVLVITEPYAEQKQLPLDLEIKWNVPDDETPATIVIATDAAMTDTVYSTTACGGELTVPEGTLLPGNKYFVTASLTYNGLAMTSPVVEFTTVFMPPTVLVPSNGVLYGDERITVERQSEAATYVIEVSNSATTWGRNRYIETLKDGNTKSTKLAREIKVNSKNLEEGKTYYLRSRLSYLDETNVSRNTDYCSPVEFVYHAEHPVAVEGDVNGDGTVNVTDVNLIVSDILLRNNSDVCDINGDGFVNVTDVNLVVSIILTQN